MARLDADLLTTHEVEALLRVCSSRAATGVRNKALIALLWRAGLRISEALALKLKDIDLDSGLVTVQRGKGDKRRVVALDVGTAALLERWLERRSEMGVIGSAPVFCTLGGSSVDPSYVRHLLPGLARRAGITKRVGGSLADYSARPARTLVGFHHLALPHRDWCKRSGCVRSSEAMAGSLGAIGTPRGASPGRAAGGSGMPPRPVPYTRTVHRERAEAGNVHLHGGDRPVEQQEP
jgi:integrase-like protein